MLQGAGRAELHRGLLPSRGAWLQDGRLCEALQESLARSRERVHEAEDCADRLLRDLQGSEERGRELTQASGEQAAELAQLREDLRHEQRWGRCYLASSASGLPRGCWARWWSCVQAATGMEQRVASQSRCCCSMLPILGA